MNTARTQVRMPAATHKRIIQNAVKNNRSMNGEIVRMLNEVIEKEKAKEKTEEKTA